MSLTTILALVHTLYIVGGVDQAGFIEINNRQYEMYPHAAGHNSCWDTQPGDELELYEGDLQKPDYAAFYNPRTGHICEVLGAFSRTSDL